MKQLLAILYLIVFAFGCGDDNPTDSGRPLVNERFTISAGAFRPFSFSIDVNTERNAYLNGTISIESGTMSFAVMNESNYQAWQEGRPYNVLYGANSSVSIGRLDITETGVYYLIFNNVQSSSPATVSAELSLISLVEAN
jgi:hypothetical protein